MAWSNSAVGRESKPYSPGLGYNVLVNRSKQKFNADGAVEHMLFHMPGSQSSLVCCIAMYSEKPLLFTVILVVPCLDYTELLHKSVQRIPHSLLIYITSEGDHFHLLTPCPVQPPPTLPDDRHVIPCRCGTSWLYLVSDS